LKNAIYAVLEILDISQII